MSEEYNHDWNDNQHDSHNEDHEHQNHDENSDKSEEEQLNEMIAEEEAKDAESSNSEEFSDESDEDAQREEEELDDAVETVTDAYEEDESILEDYAPTYEDYAAVLKFSARIIKAKRSNLRAMGEIFYNITDENKLKPLRLAEQVSMIDERSDIAETVLDYLVSRETSDPAKIRETILGISEWAYSLENENRKLVSPVLATLCAEFPNKIEKKDENGNTIYENGEVQYEEPFAPKRTNAKTGGADIIALLDQSSEHINIQELQDFMAWYREIISIWPGIEEE